MESKTNIKFFRNIYNKIKKILPNKDIKETLNTSKNIYNKLSKPKYSIEDMEVHATEGEE